MRAARLDGRMGMLGVVFLFVELGQLLYAMASSTDYLAALHEAAATAFTGPGITSTDVFSKALQLVLPAIAWSASHPVPDRWERFSSRPKMTAIAA